MEFVIPGRREAASPESSKPPSVITGFRALGLTASPRNDGAYDSKFGNAGLLMPWVCNDADALQDPSRLTMSSAARFSPSGIECPLDARNPRMSEQNDRSGP